MNSLIKKPCDLQFVNTGGTRNEMQKRFFTEYYTFNINKPRAFTFQCPGAWMRHGSDSKS